VPGSVAGRQRAHQPADPRGLAEDAAAELVVASAALGPPPSRKACRSGIEPLQSADERDRTAANCDPDRCVHRCEKCGDRLALCRQISLPAQPPTKGGSNAGPIQARIRPDAQSITTFAPSSLRKRAASCCTISPAPYTPSRGRPTVPRGGARSASVHPSPALCRSETNPSIAARPTNPRPPTPYGANCPVSKNEAANEPARPELNASTASVAADLIRRRGSGSRDSGWSAAGTDFARKPTICGMSPTRLAPFPHALRGRCSVDPSSEKSIRRRP
jgi:hypothetical protein